MMVITMNKENKTKNSIANSLIEMLQVQPLDLISIKDLCSCAKIGRTAFYNHFKNKEDVLKYIYRKAHHEIFQDKFKDLDYLRSDLFIKDMIKFFDMNSELLLVLHKWNLISIIAKYNTEMSLKYIQQCNDERIKAYSDYFVCYLCSSIFKICFLWVMNGKNLPSDDLFDTIKYFQKITKP